MRVTHPSRDFPFYTSLFPFAEVARARAVEREEAWAVEMVADMVVRWKR